MKLTLLLSSFGKSITKTGWTQAEVNPIQDLHDTWVGTLRSLLELAAEDSGAPALPHPKALTCGDTQDDSGLLDEEAEEQAEVEEDTADPGQENIDPSLGQANIRDNIARLGIRGLRQLDPNSAHVRLTRARL